MRVLGKLVSDFVADRAGVASVSFIGLSAGALVFCFAMIMPIVIKGDALTVIAVIDAAFARAGAVADLVFGHFGSRPPLL